MRWIVFALLVVAAAAIIRGVDNDQNPAGGGTVRLQTLELTDADGKVRAVLTGDSLQFMSAQGKPLMSLVVDENLAGVCINSPDGQPAVVIGHSTKSGTGITIQNKQNDTTIKIGTESDKIGCFLTARVKGERSVLVGLAENDVGTVTAMGKVAGISCVGTYTAGALGFATPEGETALLAGVSDNGGGTLTVFDKQGHPRIDVSDWGDGGPKIKLVGAANTPSVILDTVRQQGRIFVSTDAGKTGILMEGGLEKGARITVNNPISARTKTYGPE